MNIDLDLLLEIVFHANDLGKDGVRVLNVTIIPAETASQGRDQYAFMTDEGPKSATEVWEDR